MSSTSLDKPFKVVTVVCLALLFGFEINIKQSLDELKKRLPPDRQEARAAQPAANSDRPPPPEGTVSNPSTISDVTATDFDNGNEQEDNSPQVGDYVAVEPSTVGAISLQSFQDASIAASLHKDGRAIQKLYLQRKIMMLPKAKTYGTVQQTASNKTLYLIHFQSGPRIGEDWWINGKLLSRN